MKAQRIFPSCTVTQKAERSLRAGHPWVYAEELLSAPADPENGSLVDVLSEKGAYLGTGLWSEKSKIRVRVLSSNPNETFGEAFFARRVAYAVRYREDVMGEDFSACRLIFGEADGLPGVTVDRYGELLVSQILSYGMELRKDVLYRALVSELAARGVSVAGIYERSEGALRDLEGLERHKGWYAALPHPESPVTTRKTGRRPAFSSIRSITVSPSPGSPAASGCSTALPTPDPLRSTPQRAAPPA